MIYFIVVVTVLVSHSMFSRFYVLTSLQLFQWYIYPPTKCTGIENGCTEAEFLAIDDEDFQHKRLVRFYKNSGFKIIKYVGEDFQSIPDRMVWGGCGTLMRGNIKDDLLPLWSSLFIKATEREKNKINKV